MRRWILVSSLVLISVAWSSAAAATQTERSSTPSNPGSIRALVEVLVGFLGGSDTEEPRASELPKDAESGSGSEADGGPEADPDG